MTDAESVISTLRLRPHPEGGHFIETWRSAMQAGVGVGAFDSLEACVERCYRVRRDTQHTPAHSRAYDGIFERHLGTRPSGGTAT